MQVEGEWKESKTREYPKYKRGNTEEAKEKLPLPFLTIRSNYNEGKKTDLLWSRVSLLILKAHIQKS